MKKIACTNCGVPIDWNETERMLKCPYCHSQFVNESCEEDGERFYDCIYGDPITEGKKLPNVRKCLKVPEGDEIYYIYDSTILGSGKEDFFYRLQRKVEREW